MGIRVHKAVGWGLSNLHLTKEQEAKISEFCDFPWRDWMRWVQKNKDLLLQNSGERPEEWEHELFNLKNNIRKRMGSWQGPGALVHYNCQNKHIDKILFLCAPDYSRYDDTVDWVEETELAGVDTYPENRWVELKRHTKGIYPYDSGRLPFVVVALLTYLGLMDKKSELKPVLWVWWS